MIMLMQKLRRHIKYVLFIALAGFAALIFFQWGANITGMKGGQETNIAKIDGIPISYTQYTRFAQSKGQELRGVSQDEIWNMMIEEIIWNKLVKKEKIAVTDKELWEIIKSNPPREIFESEYMKNENGEFDFGKYHELLRAPQSRAWLIEYEINLRRQIPREKIRSLISTFGCVSPNEDSITLAAQTVAYDISYISLPLYRARHFLQISDAEVEEYYNKNREELANKEAKILKYVFFEKAASRYDSTEAREDLEDFIARIKEGEDFLEVAREVSDDTTVVKRFVGPTGLKPYLMKVYEKLKNDEMSDIIQASRGFEVIKRIEEGLIYKVFVRIDISPTTVGEIYDKIMSFKDAAREYGFDSAAVDFDLTVHRTYPLNKENMTFPVRNKEGLVKFLSKTSITEIGGPFSSLGGYYLFALDSIIPKTYPEFEDIKSKVKGEMERERLKVIVRDRLNHIHSRLITNTSMEEAVSEDTVVVFNDRKNVTLMQIQGALGGEFAGAVAKLEQNQISSPLIVDWAGYIIRCDKKVDNPFDSTMLLTLQMKRQQRLQQITTQIFTPNKIEDNRDLFFE